MLKKHQDQTGIENHSPISFPYANQAARESATGFVSEDLYKLAIQEDDYSVWLLIFY